MDFFALLLPIILIIALVAGLGLLRRHLFSDDRQPPPIPIPDLPEGSAAGATNVPPAAPPPPPAVRRRTNGSGNNGSGNEVNLTPARLYARKPLTASQKSVFSRLLRALPGYVVLPKITYDHFLEAQDGSPSENTSLQNRAAQHLADFIVCDKKLHVLLVCQLEDGTQLPARVQEREKMLQKSGIRLLRWNVEQPPDPAKLLNTVQTLEKMATIGTDKPPH